MINYIVYVVSIGLSILLLCIIPEFAFSFAGGVAIGWVFIGSYFLIRKVFTGKGILE